MKIVIISDLHDNIFNLEKLLNWCQKNKISKIICCGDVCSAATLKFLSAQFNGEIFLVLGNGDLYEKKDYQKMKNIRYYGLVGQEKISGLNFIFSHYEKEIKKQLEISKVKFDFAFYGHSHKPWLEKKGKLILANPGNLAGIFYNPTFAVLDTTTKNLELKILDETF